MNLRLRNYDLIIHIVGMPNMVSQY